MQRFISSLLLISLALFAPLASAQQSTCPYPTRGWPVSSPEEQGMSSERLARLVEFGTANNVDSLLVTRHGRIVLEATYAPFRPGLKHRLNSATKAVVSTLIGMAQGEGLLSGTDLKLVDFFTDRTIANLDERKKEITLRHLLDMTSGLAWKEGVSGFPESFFAMERSPDWQQFVLDRPMAEAPGTLFYYDSGNSHLLSAILTKVTGKSALDYARDKLFGPLGIEDVLWRGDPQGISGGGAGLYMLPRDMAKIGYLYLCGGLWEGRQILPASWIEGVRGATVDMREPWALALRYGSQFWVIPRRDTWFAVGYDRQLIVIMPRLDIVAVLTGSARFPAGSGKATAPRYGFDALAGLLMAAATADAALPADPVATAELREKVNRAAIEMPAPASAPSEAASALAKVISGKSWRFAANEIGLKSLILKLEDTTPSFEYQVDRARPAAQPGPYGGPIGFDGRYAVGGHMPYGPSAARGAWSADGKSLTLEVQTLGNDDVARVSLVPLDASTMQVTFDFAVGYWVTMQARLDN